MKTIFLTAILSMMSTGAFGIEIGDTFEMTETAYVGDFLMSSGFPRCLAAEGDQLVFDGTYLNRWLHGDQVNGLAYYIKHAEGTKRESFSCPDNAWIFVPLSDDVTNFPLK